MPPRRSGRTAAAAAAAAEVGADAAPAPLPTPLDGCAIALSGVFEQTHKELENTIRALGGTVTRSLTKNTTHVVTTGGDYQDPSAKVKGAKASGLPLLKVDWVLESEAKGTKQPEDDFSWEKNMANDAKTNGTKASKADDAADNTKKRPIAVVKADEDEEKPKTKKSRTAATKKPTAKAKAEPEPEPEPEVDVAEVEDAEIKDAEAQSEPDDTKSEPAADAEDDNLVTDGQFVKKKGVVIPLDTYMPLTTYEVYVDPDSGMIYDASLNQSNAAHNNNKFYILQIVWDRKTDTFKTWTRWGRVGEGGQSAILGNGSLADAIKNFEKKFKDKSGLKWDSRDDDPKPGKYAFVEKNYNPEDDDDDDNGDSSKGTSNKNGIKQEQEDVPYPDCTLEKPIQELMELIFNKDYFQQTMAALNYDAKKMPLGRLGKSTITRGYQQLKDLAALFNDPSLAQSKWNTNLSDAKLHLSNTYYSLIPHDFGRNRPPIINEQTIKIEVELLESLSDMKDAIDLMKIDKKAKLAVHPLDSHFNNLGMNEMTTLDHKSTEFNLLQDYLNETRGSTHNVKYKVEQIFRIERQGEKDRFDNSPYAKIASDRRLLWHGSRCTNFGGILSQGLRIAPPEAPVSGYMFGKGIYLADMSSKSAGYCASYNSGGYALLLLCEAELGDPIQKLTGSSYEAGTTAKKNGMHSTWGQGRTGPLKWMDAGAAHKDLEGIKMPDVSTPPGDTKIPRAGLFYNEYIVYDVAQVKLRYLFRVKM